MTRGSGPVYVGEVDVTAPLSVPPRVHPVTGVAYVAAHLLIRFATEPIGLLECVHPADADALAELIWAELGPEITDRLASVASGTEGMSADGVVLSEDQRQRLPWIAGRAAIARPPAISVVICTRDREDGLVESLRGVADLPYPNFEVVLVDNVPTSDRNRRLVDENTWRVPVRYVVEERPGLSWARNRGAKAARGALIAFMDDDEVPDAYWLWEYARAFNEVPVAGVASGLILPRSLDNEAEQFFESLGGHSRGRGYTRRVFDVESHAMQHPLYPLPPFGAGGNLCFRRDVLDAIGYFDVALGAGTPGRGAEDTAAIADAMLAGYAVVWQPSAIIRHSHYPSFDLADRQAAGYGVGLTAFYTRMVLEDPRRLAAILKLVRRAMTDIRTPGGTMMSRKPAGESNNLRSAKIRGLASGPAAYVRSRRLQRQKELPR